MLKTLNIFFVFISLLSYAQVDLNGLWQGIIIQDGKKIDQGNIFFLEIKTSSAEGKSREELYSTDLYSLKKLKTDFKPNSVTFKQTVTYKKKTSPKSSWCLVEATLNYIDSTGYLEGKYTSSECKRNTGKIILYRSKMKFSETDETIQTHNWFDTYRKDLKNGEKAPEIRELERKNFVFKPVYFDYDKAEVKEEYYAFLLSLIHVVNGHSDLRIKVIGNTDSDGSDIYNEDLSRRRAQAITDFFVQHGLSPDRLKIEFKGEKNPVDNNKTEEGKQKNRRVDFEFI
jgi:outer membrane protein OmpA-like peptidoglycan-associated protein